MKNLLSLGLLLAGISTANAQEEVVWYADFDLATVAAKEQGKDLLVDFTGSDWCGWCIKLDEQVFEHQAFLDGVNADLILVKLDYPSGDEAKAKVPNPARNEELKSQYAVSGFPTVLLMTSEGEVFGTTGYQDMTPEEYVADLKRLTTEGKAALKEAAEIVAQFKQAEDKMPVIKLAIDRLKNLDGNPGKEKLSSVVRKVFELDAEDKHKLHVEALKGLFAAGADTEEDAALAKKLDPANEHGLAELLIAKQMDGLRSLEDVEAFVDALEVFHGLGNVQDAEVVGILYLNAAFFCSQHLDRTADAKAWAKRAKAIGGLDDDMIEFLDGILAEGEEEVVVEADDA